MGLARKLLNQLATRENRKPRTHNSKVKTLHHPGSQKKAVALLLELVH